jgi:hypothetical protein
VCWMGRWLDGFGHGECGMMDSGMEDARRKCMAGCWPNAMAVQWARIAVGHDCVRVVVAGFGSLPRLGSTIWDRLARNDA